MRWLQVPRRLYSSTHSRDISCFFSGNKVTYSIPIHFAPEKEAFGSVLDIVIDLSGLQTTYVLNKSGRSLGCCDEKIAYYKSSLEPKRVEKPLLLE